MAFGIEAVQKLFDQGLTLEQVNKILDVELNKKDPDPKPEDKTDPKPEDKTDPKPEDKTDPKPEDKTDPDPDLEAKEKEINDLKEKIKKMQEDNRRKSGSPDATAAFKKDCDDLINKISAEL